MGRTRWGSDDLKANKNAPYPCSFHFIEVYLYNKATMNGISLYSTRGIVSVDRDLTHAVSRFHID